MSTPPRKRRHEQAAERRRAIVDAALAVFGEQGFAAARMEDVATRAGVAKGTLYLHFADKRALFSGIVEAVIRPSLGRIQDTPRQEGESLRAFLERVLVPVARELGRPPGRDVIRLLISDGTRFPEVADIYFREIVEPGLRVLSALAEEARRSGLPGADALAHFPQLAVAPVLMGVIWTGLFERQSPLDIDGLVGAQLDLLLGPTPPVTRA